MKIAFTGHRPENMPFDRDSDAYCRLETALWKVIREKIQEGCDTFYCGAARGMDIECGEIILAEKETDNPQIRLVCVVPFVQQAKSWNTYWQLRYARLLDEADELVQMCEHYQRGCYHMRNRYMVDQSDAVIAIYDGQSNGGTAYTVNYARQQGKEVIVLNPYDFC